MRLKFSACVCALLFTSACGKQVEIRPLFPPAADLRIEPKPVPTDAIVTDAKAAAQYDADVESWGDRGWRTVGRICRWANANGGAFDCPKP